jgi:flagellar protein FlaJ
MYDQKVHAKKIETLAKEVKDYKEKKKRFLEAIEELKKNYPNKKVYEEKLNEFLKGRTVEEWTAYFDSHISQLLKEMEVKTDEITEQLSPKEGSVKPKSAQEPVFYLGKEEEKKYIAELKIDEEYLEQIRPKKEEAGTLVLKEYTVYEANHYGKTANKFVEQYSEKLIKSMPKQYESLVYALRTSDTKILSKTYVSMMLFTSIITTFVALLIIPLITLLTSQINILNIIKSVFGSLVGAGLAGAATMAIFYFYPIMQANSRRRQIKNDLPFVIIHMSAVAGSGAQPISMFNLLFGSGEYKGLEGEIKKIINYVNLFGYNLSTALRTVALTTPSAEFRELLTGIVTTTETGGDLKQYLTSKAEDAMASYNLERKKDVESLATYSDVYTGILIAAPLLFFVTLAIINLMGGSMMGMTTSMLATLGTYVALPILNIGFIVFLNLMQPG